jgi:hypothetical protein
MRDLRCQDRSVHDSAAGRLPSVPFLTAYALEDVNPVLLGMDPNSLVPTPQIDAARALLGSSTPDPKTVVLVVTGDMVESVRKRLANAAEARAYNDARGAGTLVGKTMPVGDETHVLMPAWIFADNDAARNLLDNAAAKEWIAGSEARSKSIARTVVHEAQHVILQRAGEDQDDFPGEPRARHSLLMIAHTVVDEYRAELGVPKEMREDFELSVAPESLKAWREGIRHSVQSYQSHLNVERLMQEVLIHCQHAWKALGNVAAARRVLQASNTAHTDVALWKDMAAQPWPAFEQALAEVPPPSRRTPARELRARTEDLANALSTWLRTLGFVWRDTDDGANAEFLIVSRHITD